MQIIIGLGNPGAEYAITRHNAGWLAVDAWAQANQAGWQLQKKLQAEVAKDIAGDRLFIKPQTFMNNSGQAVRAVLDYYAHFSHLSATDQKAVLQDLLIVHDDLDLTFGQVKLQFGKGPKVHNGLLSLEAYLGTQEFWRGRMGVDGRGGNRKMPAKNYVLQPFTLEEQLSWPEAVKQLWQQWQQRQAR
jgi:PTH1 family peptidyl-tRNA hydrolase